MDEPGRPLGYLFLDKLFQLSVPMPAMGVETQSGYLGALLGVDSGTATPKTTDEIQELRARVVSGRSELDVLKALYDADPVARQAVVTDAIARMSTPEITTSTEHALQRFAPMLLANPRSMKRFVNTYSVLRILRTLEGGTVPLDALAVWTAIRIRWPLLADHLQHDADLIEKVKAAEEATTVDDLPKPLRKLVRQPAVRKFLEGAPVDLTPAVIRSCCGGQVG
ncbi:COG0683: ABC-type branched-chain amino acid transport systems, periplasmic component [Alloactinosynnema sp. L-07]|nr:COG0683: ABC-type branched-chain amino acid transport systems, periplasmic component [Alloactinosynnema sp. L-07]